MESYIASRLNGKFKPIVLIKTDEKPEDAIGPKSGRGGCVMAFIAQTIAKRKTTVFGRENATCGGIYPGFGWGDGFKTEADKEFQATFLSCGVDSAKDKEEYIKILEKRPKHIQKMFGEGERIYTDYQTAYDNISARPIYDGEDYVVFKPLEDLKEGETPDSVIFTLNSFELMLLLQLDGSHRSKSNFVCVPQASACQLIGCFVFEQAKSEDPHMVLGPVDLAARKHMKHFIPKDYVTLAMPWKLFLKLEEISKNSLFQSHLFEEVNEL